MSDVISNLSKGIYGNIPAPVVRFITRGKPVTTNGVDAESYDAINFIVDNIRYYVKEGHSLLIASNHAGNGKTLSAVRIGIANASTGIGGFYFVNIPYLLDLSKKSISNAECMTKLVEIERTISTAGIVIFDDIATKGYTEYENSILYRLINSCQGSIIYTSNILPSELRKVIEQRVADRVLASSSIIFNGDSFRTDDWMDRYNDYKKKKEI